MAVILAFIGAQFVFVQGSWAASDRNQVFVLEVIANAPAIQYSYTKSLERQRGSSEQLTCDWTIYRSPTSREFEGFAFGYWQHEMMMAKMILSDPLNRGDATHLDALAQLNPAQKAKYFLEVTNGLEEFCKANPQMTFLEAVMKNSKLAYQAALKASNTP